METYSIADTAGSACAASKLGTPGPSVKFLVLEMLAAVATFCSGHFAVEQLWPNREVRNAVACLALQLLGLSQICYFITSMQRWYQQKIHMTRISSAANLNSPRKVKLEILVPHSNVLYMTVMVKHACHSQADSRHAPTTIISYVLIVDRRTSMLTDTAAISQLFFILLHLKHVLFVAKVQKNAHPNQ